ncbi:MAG: UvrB/UvrC motif-containing protein [Chitinispirillales bacterium]|jgi:protein arginine kinase activator|nr:UvrB/UvrC motif-containing protein [Chitinispirillales bacterium]
MGEEWSFNDGMDEGINIGMSMCNDCAINPATIHLTHIEQNGAQTHHLCEECARGRGVPIPDGETLLKGLEAIVGNAAAMAGTQVKLTLKQPEREREEVPNIKCPTCRTKLSDFRATGRLGCPGCYGCFGEQVEKLHLQIHGSSGHRGKKYGAAPRKKGKKEIERLQRELSEAISSERFEQAAVIRDAIRGIGQGTK